MLIAQAMTAAMPLIRLGSAVNWAGSLAMTSTQDWLQQWIGTCKTSSGATPCGSALATAVSALAPAPEVIDRRQGGHA